MEKYQVTKEGYYGEFGGSYVPEVLEGAVKELASQYKEIIESEAFKKEYKMLLKEYVGRPSPLYHAANLSEKYGTNVYLKREDLNHTGAHKINNTLGQILLAKHLGKKKVIAETGAGQHGVATATVCAKFGMECIIFMGAIDVKKQAPNVARIKFLGAEVVTVESGGKTLKDAVDAALGYWIANPDSYFLIGSVVGPHPYPDLVARLQSVISEELQEQLREKPDYIIACVGGGSNAAGAFYHYLDDEQVQLVAVEAEGKGIESGKHAATLAVGKPGVLHGSRTLVIHDEKGEVLEPYSISSGLDYPGVGPLYSYLQAIGRVKAICIKDDEALEAAKLLAQKEGIIPALESSHALAALEKLSFAKEDVVVVNLSGRGDKDMETYLEYFKY